MGFLEEERAMKRAANNGDIDAVIALAGMYFNQMDYKNAVYWARRGARINDVNCLFYLGEIAFSQGNYSEAEQWFSRNININSDDDSASELGFMYIKQENFETASNCFGFALRQNRNHPDASYGMAVCMLNDGVDDINELNEIKRLMQNALKSANAQVRDDAKQTLNEIRNSERRADYNSNNNSNNCFITTAVCESFDKPDDCFELTAFRNFRDTWLVKQSDGKSLIAEYYSVAPKIVANINKLPNAEEIYKKIWLNYLSPCLEFIKRGDNPACKNKYVEMVKSLKKIYF